jgi:glycosyltransferase involved in cell wall biosynthesis
MRVICLVKRFDHHTASGGYDRLAAAVSAKIIRRKHIPGILGKVANKMWQHLSPKKDYYTDYKIGDWLAELHALVTCFLRAPDVVHVLYSGQINLLIKWRCLLRCPLIVTFHAPFENAGQRFAVYRNGLDIDAAVIIANSQAIHMARWIEPGKIVYIPHGIDTDQFWPGEPIQRSHHGMRVLIVGHHMRDWVVIHRTIDEINHRGLNVEFELVTDESYSPYLTGCANLVHLSGISEAELIGLYRKADVLFIPVTNATANNSILEALACGTPVISTLIGGIPDYVGESGWLLPVGDVIGHVNLLASLADNKALIEERRQAARAQSLKFDWRVVAEQMIALYAAVNVQRRRD